MYHHKGIYYLYYLTSERAPGDGFGLATSKDGIKWHDYGRVLDPSADMVGYLGTGSLWKDAAFAETGRFLCNYSEWRLESNHYVQTILFAWSNDLIHWHKFGDDLMFKIDERFYEKVKEDARGPWEWPRWDGLCVVPRPGGGYYGYWTATPKDALGFGFGESADGLHWQALEPPQVRWGDPPEMYFVEVGGVHELDQRYYCMVGDYADTNCGMFTLVSNCPWGPFQPAAKNFRLLSNQSKMHVYFSRFLDTPEGVLVNHHTLAEGQFSDDHFVVYFAPLKQVRIIDGGMYLAWWRGNDRLKYREIEWPAVDSGHTRFSTDAGIVLEGAIDLAGSLFIRNGDGAGVTILVKEGGATEIGPGSQTEGSYKCEESIDRGLEMVSRPRFRLLLHHTMLEFYLEDILIQCYTMEIAADGRISFENVKNLRLWQWQ
jgi:hypothetical protein